MSRLLPAWRASLRLAVRSITRAKGRSALVALMVGTPVALAVALTTFILTEDISPKENLSVTVGSSQARASYLGGTVTQDPMGSDYGSDSSGYKVSDANTQAWASKIADLTDASVVTVDHGFAQIGARRLDVVQSDFSRPATRGLIVLKSGRLPSAADEVVASTRVAGDGKATVGSRLPVEDGELKVVGIGTIGSIVGGTDQSSIALLPSAPVEVISSDVSYLIDRKASVTWADVQKLNKAGFVVESKAVINDPPSDAGYNNGSSGNETLTRLIVVAIMIEIILLAGPAFAVGVRQQRRQLALIAAAGGSPRDIRRVVLAQASVLGLGASVVGAAIGLATARLIIAGDWVPKGFEGEFGPFDWSFPLMLLAILLGSAAAIIAAYAPARHISKEPLPTVLAGRRLEAGSRDGWPAFGLVLAVMGLLMTVTASRISGETDIAWGSILIVVGVVFMTPTLIRFTARISPRLPLPLRLALRDTARHTSRSAPAIAAVMAAVAGITALGIGSTSDQEQARRDYIYTHANGTAVIYSDGDLGAAAKRITDRLPDRTVTPIAISSDTMIERTKADCVEDQCFWEAGATGYESGSDMPAVNFPLVVADDATLKAWGVDLTAAESKALKQGKALVQTLDGVGPERALNIVTTDPDDFDTVTSTHKVGVVEADLHTGAVPQGPEPVLAGMVVSPEKAKQLDLPLATKTAIISGSVSEEQQKTISKLVGQGENSLTSSTSLEVERGHQSELPLLYLLLAGIGGAAVLIGTLSATGLALNDARPDFATLNAIGAAPVTRRIMAAAQALTIGVIGVLLGLAIGILPGILAARSLTSGYVEGAGPVVVIPWLLFAILLFVVPFIAASVSGLFLRNNNVAVRRVAG